MLDTTRAASYVPGSNRLEAASGAAWLALLPTQQPARVLVLGVPGGVVLEALSRAAGRLTVRCRTKREGRRARTLLAERPARVEVGEAPLPEASFDLILLARTYAGDPSAAARSLAPGGTLVAEEAGSKHVELAGQRIALRPPIGDATAAVSEAAPNAKRALETRGLWASGVVARAFGRSRAIGGRWIGSLPERRLVIGAGGPPAYLQRIAGEAGFQIGSHDWAMAAPGRYRSNKILFFLFEPGAGSPVLVVKVTRDAELNGRLEVEREALDHLHESGVVDPSTIPAVAFSGKEAGRAVLGLTAIEGRPFNDVTRASADCPHTARAFDWLLDLGTATATPSVAAGGELGGHLRDLYGRFLAVYELGAEHRSFLEAQIHAIEHAREPFPVVFQHGDPGAWNLLVREDGSVAFLDWEAAERRGVPLWDVFHLARSFAVIVGRAGGEQNMMRAIDRILFSPTPINRMVGGIVGRYRERVGVPAALVEPLFHTSWMHRALKEAMRLPKDRVGTGHYLALLRRGIDQRESQGLREIFGRAEERGA